MSLPRGKAWFHAKTYGWGWGLPARWQGWVVMAAFVALLMIAARNVPGYVAYCVAMAAALVAVCWWKGEPPKWRWGRTDE